MHFIGREGEMTAPFAYSEEAQYRLPTQHQPWAPYPSPSYHPIQLPQPGSTLPPHPMHANSYPPPLPLHTYQRPVPPIHPRPSSYAPSGISSKKEQTSTLRHPKSYYQQFRNLPTLNRSARASPAPSLNAEVIVPAHYKDEDYKVSAVEDGESDSGASVVAMKAKKKAGKVHRRRKTLSCEPCRRKKIRCDRNLECGPCDLRGIPCIWAENSAPNVARDAGALPTSNPQDVQTIDHLRKLIRQLGSQLNMDSKSIDTLIAEEPIPTRPPIAPRRTRSLRSQSDNDEAGDDVLVWPSPVSARPEESSEEGGKTQSEPASAPATPPTSNPSDTPGAPLMVLDALDQLSGGGTPFLSEYQWYGDGAAQIDCWRWEAGMAAGSGRA